MGNVCLNTRFVAKTRWLAALLLVVMLFGQTGCAAMVRYQSPSLTDRTTASRHNVRSLSFFWGLLPPSRISLEQCGHQGIQSMKVRQGIADRFISAGTLGIIISYKVKIKCADGV